MCTFFKVLAALVVFRLIVVYLTNYSLNPHSRHDMTAGMSYFPLNVRSCA